MIRALRSRFILGAMLALAILLLLLDCGIVTGNYLRMEQRGDQALERLLDSPEQGGRPAPQTENQRGPRDKIPLFGYEIPAHGPQKAYYLVHIDADGKLDVDARGIVEPDLEALEDEVRQILSTGAERGKAGAYKFALRRLGDGTIRVVLLDNALQLQSLMDLLRTVLIASALGLAAMFVILLPVSKQMVRSYAVNAEKQRQFITNAGHEIKTPVAIIRSNIDAMELIQGENKWSRNIRGQVERLGVLLQELMQLARLDERGALEERVRLDLSALAAEDAEQYRERFAQRDLALRCEIAAGIWIRGSAAGMRQLMHALLDNAAQYADAGGWVELKLERSARRVQLTLRNSVSALPPCPPERLFERFYRGDSARTQGAAGCGVGLSAAQAIAEQHRGRIFVAYEEGPAVRFVLELPG